MNRIAAAFEAPALVAGINDFAVMVTRPSSAVVILKNPLECSGSSPFLITLLAINRFRDLWKKKIISLLGRASRTGQGRSRL
jgi:hypothetical protein